VKRRVYLPERTVTVEDGTVRDLDGNLLGVLRKVGYGWQYCNDIGVILGVAPLQAAALAALLADSRCPTPGPNRYDR
jgi:hypothetical protein